MDAWNAKVVATSSVISLLIVLIVLWLCLGLSTVFFVVAGIELAAIFAIFVWVLALYSTLYRRQMSMVRRSAVEGEEMRVQYSFLRKVAGLPIRFSYEALEAATDNFQSIIGRGSSAAVFKGILDDGTAVAVKRIEEAEYGDREFKTEVSAIASVQHVNLIRLLGYCLVPRRGPRYLVYEFVENGSLDKWIFSGPEPSRRRCLPWPLRCRVAVDVAKALSYLHNDCRARVLHLDVKPENILLDESFRAVVADFGLSKLMGRDESRVVTTVRGTRGYLAPEWFIGTGISEKCDIYSYGMVLLEIVGGRRNLLLTVSDSDFDVAGGGAAATATAASGNRKFSYFPKIVSEMVREGRVMEVVDGRVAREAEEREVRTLVHVALWCIQEEEKQRPSMARVVDMLEGRMLVETPPPETGMIVSDLLSTEHFVPAADDARRGGGGAQTLMQQLLLIPEPSTSSGYSMDDVTMSEITVLSGR